MEEDFREAVCVGNTEVVKQFIKSGVNVNSQNAVNGWTALHWAVKRNHQSLIDILLQAGAKEDIKNNDGATPFDLVVASNKNDNTSEKSQKSSISEEQQSSSVFVPNYLKNPVFPYNNLSQFQHLDHLSEKSLENSVSLKSLDAEVAEESGKGFLYHPKSVFCVRQNEYSPCGLCVEPKHIVFKVRVEVRDRPKCQYSPSAQDFIEVSFNRQALPSFEEFKATLKKELRVQEYDISTIRKLPDSVIRNENDVRRLTDYQMIVVELVPAARRNFSH